jgi:hypothetical protein
MSKETSPPDPLSEGEGEYVSHVLRTRISSFLTAGPKDSFGVSLEINLEKLQKRLSEDTGSNDSY